MKPLSTVIIITLLAGILFSVSGDIRAQQSSASTQKLSKRLLDAVDGNDVEAVRSILAIASGRSLVALPIGLAAAGRAVERGYYEVAHHILAVRNQQIQVKRKVRTTNPSTERSHPAAASPQSASPAKNVRRISPPLLPDRQTPRSLEVTVPIPAVTPIPKATARAGDPDYEPPPPLSGPNPFEPSHTPGSELPRLHPVDRPDNRSDRSDTFPIARVASPPDLPLQELPQNTAVDTEPISDLPTPIGASKAPTEREKTGFLWRLMGTVSGTFIKSDKEPGADSETPGTPASVRSTDAGHVTVGKPIAPPENTRPPERINLTANATPSDSILSSLTRFITPSDPSENTSPLKNSLTNTLATESVLAPRPIASTPDLNTNDEFATEAELTKLGNSKSHSGKSLSSGPEVPGFIELIKKVLRYDAPKPEPAMEELSVFTSIAAKSLDSSPLNPGENTTVAHRQNVQATGKTIAISSPLPAKPVGIELENVSPAGRTHDSPPLAADALMPPVHIRAERKVNPFSEKSELQEKPITLPSRLPPTLSAGKVKAPARNAVTQPGTRMAAIRSGSVDKMRATATIPRAENSRSGQRAALPQVEATASKTLDRHQPMFRIGESLILGRALSPKAVASGQCFRKGRVTGWYCLEEANWPEEIAKATSMSAWHYRDASTVVRYKSGKAVRIYSVIPSNTYDDAVRYYTSLLGPPTKVLTNKLVRLGNTPLSNPSSIWIHPSKKGGMQTLEIRRFDNIRGLIASDTVGLIRLFEENSNPIFAVLSDTDLILHQIRGKNKK